MSMIEIFYPVSARSATVEQIIEMFNKVIYAPTIRAAATGCEEFVRIDEVIVNPDVYSGFGRQSIPYAYARTSVLDFIRTAQQVEISPSPEMQNDCLAAVQVNKGIASILAVGYFARDRP